MIVAFKPYCAMEALTVRLCAILFQALIIIAGLQLVSLNTAHAQAIDTGQQSEAGKEFREHAKSQWQRTDALALGPNDSLELTNPERQKPRSLSNPFQGVETARILSTIILIVLIAIAVYLFLRYRLGGDLFSGKKNDQRIGREEESIAGLNVAEAGRFALSDLENMAPKEALHILLVKSLAKAADTNNIPLRRSLTARDVFNVIPDRWAHRGFLGKLIKCAEPVLFGGRSITGDDVKALAQEAEPLFSGRRMGLGR